MRLRPIHSTGTDNVAPTPARMSQTRNTMSISGDRRTAGDRLLASAQEEDIVTAYALRKMDVVKTDNAVIAGESARRTLRSKTTLWTTHYSRESWHT
jgi:hypothetical protein